MFNIKIPVLGFLREQEIFQTLVTCRFVFIVTPITSAYPAAFAFSRSSIQLRSSSCLCRSMSYKRGEPENKYRHDLCFYKTVIALQRTVELEIHGENSLSAEGSQGGYKTGFRDLSRLDTGSRSRPRPAQASAGCRQRPTPDFVPVTLGDFPKVPVTSRLPKQWKRQTAILHVQRGQGWLRLGGCWGFFFG